MSEVATDPTVAVADLEALPPDVKKLVQGGRLLNALGADPKTRSKMLGLIKEASPNTPIPELDLQRDMDERVAAQTKPLADENAALKERLEAVEGRIKKQDLLREHELTDDDVVAIEELKKGGISDDALAIEHHRMRMSLNGPRPTVEPGVEKYQEKLRKINPRAPGGVKALEAAAIEEGARVLRELRGGRRIA